MNLDPRRWAWSSGFAFRFSIPLVLLFVLCLWIGGGIYINDRAKLSHRLFTDSIAQRIESIVPLLETTLPQERQELIRALNSPTLAVFVSDKPPHARVESSWWLDPRRLDELRESLPDLGSRTIVIEGLDREFRDEQDHDDQSYGLSQKHHNLQYSRVRVRISVGLATGEWAQFLAAAPSLSYRWALRTVAWATVATVIVIFIVFWFSFRQTRPLRRFADAADRIGRDIRSPQLDETGSRELRKASRAFNRMQERLRSLLDDRTMMLAAISHDLKTMLTRLRLRIEFINDPAQREKAVADLFEMQAMLNETLSFAGDDAADAPRVRSDLTALVHNICESLSETGCDIRVDASKPIWIDCSPGHIRRAIENIIGNAVKYGSVAEVWLETQAGYAIVTVMDRGPGIPVERIADVFRPFYRLETSRNRETGGSGLGLTVALSVVRRHGGDIALRNRETGGLCVRISLPGVDKKA